MSRQIDGKQLYDDSIAPEKLFAAFVADLLRASVATAWLVNQNAGGKRLTDLGAPVDPSDAARLVDITAAALITSVFGRTGDVEAATGDYAASQINNDSSVPGTHVDDALEVLAAAIPSVPVSSVFGRIGAVVATLGDYVASKVTNDSSVSGSTVKDALNALLAAIPSVPVSSVFGRTGAIVATLGDYVASKVNNDSSVSGSTVKDALNALLAAIPSVPVSSVFGRTGAVVAAANDYAASQISNDSSVSGSKVKDALNALLAAIPSVPVSSVFGRTGAVVATAGDYSKSDVGLGNVTNDAQLKRAAGDFASFAQKATPASADVIPIEDSAASGAKKYITVGSLPGTGGLGVRDYIWDPPSTPGANDDEFTVDGLASGVWQLYSDTSPVTTAYTRDGAIDLTQVVAASHFRSEVRGSTLWVQIPLNTGVLMVRQVASAITTKQLWKTGFCVPAEWDTVSSGTSAGTGLVQFMLWLGIAGPKPDNANRARWGTQDDATVIATRVAGGAVTGATRSQANIIHLVDGIGGVVDHNVASPSVNILPFTFRRNGTYSMFDTGQAPAFNTSTTFFGYLLTHNPVNEFAGAGKQGVFGFDFVRHQTFGAGVFLAQS